MKEYKEVFLFAAKVGSLEGYLFERESVEPLTNWVDNVSRMYSDLPSEMKKELAADLVPVLKRVLEYGGKMLEAGLKEKLEQVLHDSVSAMGEASDKGAG
jgi:hypothetical protein